MYRLSRSPGRRPARILGVAFVLTVLAAVVAAPVSGVVSPGAIDGGDSVSSDGVAASHDDQDEPQDDVRSIEYAQTVVGSIDEEDPHAEDRRGYHEPVTFEGAEGEVVSVQMRAASSGGYHHGGGGVDSIPDTYVMLVGPDGEVIAENDDAGTVANSVVHGIRLPEDGEYTVVATTYNESQTFQYQLTLENLDQETSDLRTIELNSTALSHVDKDDPADEDRRGYYEPVTFDGEAGQTVTVDMGSQTGDTYLQLLGPNGNVIEENDDAGRSLNSSIEGVTLPQDGEYTIVATSFSRGDTFEYELSVEVVGSGDPGGADARTISSGEAVQSELDASDPSAPFLRGTYEPVTFEGEAGQSVAVDMTSDEGDSYLMLYGPDGDVVAENDDYDGLDARIVTDLNQTGEYTIIATSFDEDATFSYTLTMDTRAVERTDLRTISYGETAEGYVDQSDPASQSYRGNYEPVTFDGSAGDQVEISMDSEGDTYLFLLAPNGTVLAENDDHDGLDARIRTELPDDGQYTIIATTFNPRETLAYDLTLEQTDG